MSTVYIVSVPSAPAHESIFYLLEQPILSFVFRLKKFNSQKLDDYVRTNTDEVITAFADHNKPGLSTRDVIKLLEGTNRRRDTCLFIRRLLTEHRNAARA